MSSYPSIKDEDFYEKLNKKYKKYEIPKKRKTFKQICYPSEYKLQLPQEFLAKYINPSSPYKGVLVFHRIGAGKTCTAVNIAEQWKDKRKIMVLVPASLIGNFRDELRSPCASSSYLTSAQRKKLTTLHPSSKEYKDIIKESDKKINKHYSIMSYNKFVEKAKDGNINLTNTLLIVDEIQNMVSEDGSYYEELYNVIHNAPSSLRIVLLSATPMFDKPVEIALTMNLLRIPVEFPTGIEFERTFIKCVKDKKGRPICQGKNMDMFKDMIKGYVSYFRGAPPYAFPEESIKYVRCEMSNFQYRSYITVLKAEEKRSKITVTRRHQEFKKGQIKTLPNNFFIGTRVLSNIAFPNKNINEKGYKSFEGNHLKMKNLKNYSIKFYKIMQRVKAATGPVFIYSNFKGYGGLKSFMKVLEAQGFRNYSEFGEGYKRFAIWSGDESIEKKQEIKEVFNQPSNYNGSKLRVMLASPSAKEGVSFKNVRQIHIMEPYWNNSRIQQVVGRGVRYCSHKGLPEEKRNVKVYIYLATHPREEETVDEYIYQLSTQKNKLIEQFDMALKESAVDCTLFKNANVYEGEPDIECVV